MKSRGRGAVRVNGAPPRQALHAWRIRLRHPRTDTPLTLTAPLPGDFIATARQALRES